MIPFSRHFATSRLTQVPMLAASVQIVMPNCLESVFGTTSSTTIRPFSAYDECQPRKSARKAGFSLLLVHGVGHDERTWFPLFSVCYFHHDKDKAVTRSHNQAHTMDGIAVGRSPTSNALLVYNPRTKQYYEPDSYRLIPIDCLPWFIHLSNMTVVSSVHYIGTTTQAWKSYTLRARASNNLTHQPICSWQERSWIPPFTPIRMVQLCI